MAVGGAIGSVLAIWHSYGQLAESLSGRAHDAFLRRKSASSLWLEGDFDGLSLTNVMQLLERIKAGDKGKLEITDKELDAAFDDIGGALSKYMLVRDDLRTMTSQLESADSPYLATAAIRERITEQVLGAERLHRQSVVRTVVFLALGICVIFLGLIIVGYGLYTLHDLSSTESGGPGSNLKWKDLMILAPIGGAIFNVVGGGLILLHREASRTAMQYYDRKQNLYNLLIALELTTNKLMETKREEVLVALVQSLTSGIPPSPPASQ
jgi:hypothetical protein